MANKETARANFPEPSFSEFYKALGVNREQAQEIRGILEKRLMKALDSFPFSSAETSDMPILSMVFPSDAEPRIILPGLTNHVQISTIEKIMDNVIISKSNFTDDGYKYGPIHRTFGKERGSNSQRFYDTYEFLVVLPGGRAYVVTKGTDYTKFLEDANGMLSRAKKIHSVNYAVSLAEDDLMSQMVMDEDASNDFGFGNQNQ